MYKNKVPREGGKGSPYRNNSRRHGGDERPQISHPALQSPQLPLPACDVTGVARRRSPNRPRPPHRPPPAEQPRREEEAEGEGGGDGGGRHCRPRMDGEAEANQGQEALGLGLGVLKARGWGWTETESAPPVPWQETGGVHFHCPVQ